VIPLFFVIVFSVSPEQKIESLVIGATQTLEECATKKKKAEFDSALYLKEHPTTRIECVQLMGTV